MKNMFFFILIFVFFSCLITTTFCRPGFIINENMYAQASPDSIYYKRLYYTAKVWGYFKYFHSEVAKGTKDWDQVLIQTLKDIKGNLSDHDFNTSIAGMIDKAGKLAIPTTQFNDVPDSLKINIDFNWLHDPGFSDEIKVRLDSVKNMFRPHNNYYIGSAGAGNPTFETDSKYYKGSANYPDEEIRLLALFRYWNIINYFYPYKPLLDKNWDSTLVDFIPKIQNASNDMAYHKVFLELSTRINDSHASTTSQIISEVIYGSYYLPVTLKYVENETVVTGIYPGTKEIKIGDVIKFINGIDIYSIRDSIRKYTYGSNDAAINRNINTRLTRGKNESVRITLENEDGVKNVTIVRNLSSSEYTRITARNDAVWKIINVRSKKYGYVDMGRLEKEQIPDMFNDLWNTNGIVFDIRNYPRGTLWYMINYLFRDPINIANFSVPSIRYPGTISWILATIGQGDFSNNYKNNIFILFDESTLSQAEYTIMGLEQHPKAIKVGSQTAGADGNVSLIYLPGGISSYFTGLGTFYPDFTETQRIGIVPDIEVHPTIAGIRKGEDEVLAAAFSDSIISIVLPPGEYNLFQNYPNPFNPTTKIIWQLASGGNISLIIFDILGSEVAVIYDGNKPAGRYETEFSANNLASGIYFCRLAADGYVKTIKMMVLK